MRHPLVPLFPFFVFYFSSVLSFSVSVGSSPTRCGPLNITWTGGHPPFQIMLVPVYGTPKNISIPSTSFNDNHGSHQIASVPFSQGSQFLLTMSDAIGFGTGGVSELLTVGAPIADASCNTTDPHPLFTFGLPLSLQQCRSYVFNGYGGAALPVTIAGLIPGGDSFLLETPSTGASFTWLANVAAGTTIVFIMIDANGSSGGSSDTETVALSSDTSCLNIFSPTSTVSLIPSSTSGSPTSSPAQTSSGGVFKGTIVGTAVGVALAIVVIVALAVFYLRGQRYKRSPYGFAPARNSRRHSVELDPGTNNDQPPPICPFPYHNDSTSHLAPQPLFSSSTPSSHVGTSSSTDRVARGSGMSVTYQGHSRANSTTPALGDIANSSMSSGGRRKAAMAGMTSYPPSTRFIIHTDAEEQFPEAEVVELPPQYSERRTPPARLTTEGPISATARAPNKDRVGESPRSTSHLPE